MSHVECMRTIATDVPVACCVCQFVVSVSYAPEALQQTAERIEILFGIKIPGGPRNTVSVGGPEPLRGARSQKGRGSGEKFCPLLCEGKGEFNSTIAKSLWLLVISK